MSKGWHALRTDWEKVNKMSLRAKLSNTGVHRLNFRGETGIVSSMVGKSFPHTAYFYQVGTVHKFFSETRE